MSTRKPAGGRTSRQTGRLREQEASTSRGGPLIGKGRGAPIEDPERPPVERSRTPDELERETVEGREERAGRKGRDMGPARE